MNKTTTWSLHWRHWIQVVVLLIIFDHFWSFSHDFHSCSNQNDPSPAILDATKSTSGLRPVPSGSRTASTMVRSNDLQRVMGNSPPVFFWGLDMGFIHWPSQEPIDWRYRFHICLAYFSGLCLREYPSKIFGQKYGTVRVPPFQDPEDLPLKYL